jgi:hypothetical protein
MIFIFFTTKRFGVPSTIYLMIEDNVFMRIIGRITEDNLKFMDTNPSPVYVGNQMISLQNMKMDVQINMDAIDVMVGKNSNIIQKTIELDLVHLKIIAKREEHVLIFTQ